MDKQEVSQLLQYGSHGSQLVKVGLGLSLCLQQRSLCIRKSCSCWEMNGQTEALPAIMKDFILSVAVKKKLS